MRPIDADALKKSLDISPDDWAKGRTIEHIINEAPTLDYAPVRHGEWGTKPDGFIPADIYCSECGKRYIFFYDPNYCPNCGAKMDGGKNDV